MAGQALCRAWLAASLGLVPALVASRCRTEGATSLGSDRLRAGRHKTTTTTKNEAVQPRMRQYNQEAYRYQPLSATVCIPDCLRRLPTCCCLPAYLLLPACLPAVAAYLLLPTCYCLSARQELQPTC